MKIKDMKFKSLLFGGLALALAACSSEDIQTPSNSGDNNVSTPESTLSTATYNIAGGDQTRVTNLGQWTPVSTRADEDWKDIFNYTLPSDAVDITKDNFDQNASVYFVPSNFNGEKNFEWKYNIINAKVLYIQGNLTNFVGINFPDNLKIYIATNYSPSTLGNNWNNVNIIVLPEYELTINSVSLNNSKLYNAGTVNMPNGFDGSKIQEVYNSGEFNVGKEGNSLIFPAGVTFNSNGGPITVKGSEITLESTCNINNLVTFEGNLKIQTNYTSKYVCGLNVKGNIEIVGQVTLTTSYINANSNNISLNSSSIKLTNEGYVHAGEISFEGNGRTQEDNYYEAILSQEGSYGMVDVTSFNCKNDKLSNHLGAKVYTNFKTIKYKDGGQEKNATSDTYDDVLATADAINNPNVGGTPECGDYWGKEDPKDPQPSLDLITDIESPTHDHDKDKNDPNRRHLSATSLTFDGNGNIYASYHMRGGNWGGDTYDKDDIEGCIERWTFDGNKLTLGNWMWTNDFDFNHIYLDKVDNNIITVGHKGGENKSTDQDDKDYTDYGGIIGRMPTGVWENNWNADQVLTRQDFEYKYLTTDEEKYDWYENPESGNLTWQLVDYESAGDGNCVVRVGNEYFVATSKGYGKINASDFSRIKDEAGNVAYQSTPGSAKYLVEDNGTVYVFHLNKRIKDSQATTAFNSTLRQMDTSVFPSPGTTLFGRESLEPASDSNNDTDSMIVTPVDGKNVIAVDNGIVYTCLSKTGLKIGDNEPIKFGDSRPVNGVAIDEKYIYVANGSYITVLDKNKPMDKPVVERKGNTKNVSANFVEVWQDTDGTRYVFVAFGQDGIKVFKFNENK